jgi:ABC-type antimicrobial peptide transport system permease subunit
VGAGVLFGVALFTALRKMLAALLFGIGSLDPVTLAAAVGILLAVGFIAAFLPARRAMKVDPVAALREE